MVDLNGQYEAIKGEVDSALDSVLNATSFINGPAVKEFQNNLQKYLNVKHVIPCANGTDALQLALMSLNLSHGDEIITSNFTFASTAEVVLLMGLKLKLVDINEETFNIDPSSIENAIQDFKNITGNSISYTQSINKDIDALHQIEHKSSKLLNRRKIQKIEFIKYKFKKFFNF